MAEPSTASADHADRDLFCARCGYNLRGLPGDPKRCPECGFANPLDKLLWPAERIAKQLRGLESAPTGCIGGLLLMGFGALLLLGLAVDQSRDAHVPVIICVGLCFLTGIALWLLSASRFAASCLHRPGWRATLLRFHIHAAAIFLLGLGALFGTIGIPVFGVFGLIFRTTGALVTLAMVVAMWYVAVVLIRKLYRRTRAELLPLQREVAVAMYVRERDHRT